MLQRTQQYSFVFAALLCLISITPVRSFPFNTYTRCSGKAANMMFVMDSSSSVWIVDYKKQLKFVEKIVEPFDIGPADSQVHVGAITFSSHAHLEFSLDKYNDKEQLRKAIVSIPYRQGQTNTAEALDLLRQEISSKIKTATAPFIAVVITDGRSSNTRATRKEADRLHKLGVNVYAIGVGYYYHLPELYTIASRPENVYTVSSYSALERIVKKFNIKTCIDIEITTTPKTTPAPAPDTTARTPAPTTTTTTPAPTTTATTPTSTTTTTPATTTTIAIPTLNPTTSTPAPTTTITTTPAPTTTTTPVPTTTTTPIPTTTITLPSTKTTTATTTTTTTNPVTTATEAVRKSTPERLQRDDASTVSFGYDLVAMGAYRAHVIQKFINDLLPYTDYGHFGVVSYAYCPDAFNVPLTSLMDRRPTDAAPTLEIDGKEPTLVDVVRRMRRDLKESAIESSKKKGYHGNQVAVLFVDPSVTVLTPDLVQETDGLKRDGSKLFLVNVGEGVWKEPQYLQSMSSQPYGNYMYNYQTYDQLLSNVKQNPFLFKEMCNKTVPAY